VLDVAVLVAFEVATDDFVVVEVAPALSKGDITCFFFSSCHLE